MAALELPRLSPGPLKAQGALPHPGTHTLPQGPVPPREEEYSSQIPEKSIASLFHPQHPCEQTQGLAAPQSVLVPQPWGV